MGTSTPNERQSLAQVLSQVHTPDSFARALSAGILRDAIQKFQEGETESVEFNAKIVVSPREVAARRPPGRGGECWCLCIDGWCICICKIEL